MEHGFGENPEALISLWLNQVYFQDGARDSGMYSFFHSGIGVWRQSGPVATSSAL